MKFYTFLFIYLFFMLQTNAQVENQQDTNTQWFDVKTSSKFDGKTTLLGHSAEHVYFYSELKSDKYLEVFNKTTSEKIISIDLREATNNSDKHLKFVSVYLLKNTLILHTRKNNDELLSCDSYFQTFDIENKKFSDLKLVARIELPIENKRELPENYDPFYTSRVIISEDGESLLIYEPTFNESESNSENPKQAGNHYKVLNWELENVAEGTFDNPDEFTSAELRLVGKNSLYIKGHKYPRLSGYSSSPKKLEFPNTHLLVVNIESSESDLIEIGLDGRVMYDYKYVKNEKKQLIVAGIYFDKTAKTTGSFCIKYNDDLEIVFERFKNFKQDYNKNRDADGTKFRLEVQNLLLKPDGTFVLFAEQFSDRASTHSDNFNGMATSSTNYFYSHKDIVVANFSNQGELIWESVVEKEQLSVNENIAYSSFHPVVVGNKIHLYYNNEDHLHHVIIDEMGVQTNEQLTFNNNENISLVPSMSARNSSEMIITKVENRDVIYGILGRE